MPNTPPLLRLSPDEEEFLRRWIYDEAHYDSGTGQEKLLQLENTAIAAELGLLIAAGMPDPKAQLAASLEPPSARQITWPWTKEQLRVRVEEARAVLADARESGTKKAPTMEHMEI